ncbi:Uncharacterised protein r2_g3526 [Pycnogonum litorale]
MKNASTLQHRPKSNVTASNDLDYLNQVLNISETKENLNRVNVKKISLDGYVPRPLTAASQSRYRFVEIPTNSPSSKHGIEFLTSSNKHQVKDARRRSTDSTNENVPFFKEEDIWGGNKPSVNHTGFKDFQSYSHQALHNQDDKFTDENFCNLKDSMSEVIQPKIDSHVTTTSVKDDPQIYHCWNVQTSVQTDPHFNQPYFDAYMKDDRAVPLETPNTYRSSEAEETLREIMELEKEQTNEMEFYCTLTSRDSKKRTTPCKYQVHIENDDNVAPQRPNDDAFTINNATRAETLEDFDCRENTTNYNPVKYEMLSTYDEMTTNHRNAERKNDEKLKTFNVGTQTDNRMICRMCGTEFAIRDDGNFKNGASSRL